MPPASCFVGVKAQWVHNAGKHAGCDVTHRLNYRRVPGQRRSPTGGHAFEHADSDWSLAKLVAVAKDKVLLWQEKAETLSRSWSLVSKEVLGLFCSLGLLHLDTCCSGFKFIPSPRLSDVTPYSSQISDNTLRQVLAPTSAHFDSLPNIWWAQHSISFSRKLRLSVFF